MNKIKSSVGFLVMLLAILSCSKSFDSRFVGLYYDQNNPRGHIVIENTGDCGVVENGSVVRVFSCLLDGNTIKMSIASGRVDYDESFGYPEFRGNQAILTIDGNTLITQTGRRFTKNGTTSTNSQSSTPNTSAALTLEKAQKAIDRLASENNYSKIEITSGIREIPSQNLATADIKIDGRENNNDAGGRFGEGTGTITFSRYNDGRWFLTGFAARIPYYTREGNLGSWKNPELRTNIEVR